MKTTTFKRTPGAKWIEDEQIMCVKEGKKTQQKQPQPTSEKSTAHVLVVA